MAKTPAGKESTDSRFKDKRHTVHDLEGVRKKEEQALKNFGRKVRGEK